MSYDFNNTCACMGPQNNEPYCPCKMKNLKVKEKNGMWVIPEQTIGPVIKQNEKTAEIYSILGKTFK